VKRPTTEASQTPEALWTHLSQARWFASKGRGATPGRLWRLDWFARSEQLAVRPALVEACLPPQEGCQSQTEIYLVLLAHRREQRPGWLWTDADEPEAPQQVHDAFADPEALRLVIDRLAAAGETPTWAAARARPVDLSGELKVFGGEQSNTSVMVGDTAMVKFFRRLEQGANLDIAVHDALGRAGVTSVARLHGWLTSTPCDGIPGPYDLAMIVQQLPQAVDGWKVATESVREGQDFSSDARALGEALAEVHRALVDTFPAASLPTDDVAEVMARRLEAAMEEAPVLAELADGLRELFSTIRGRGIPAQRIHGDFHLGQTLDTAQGWRIIDFEGEPIKTLAERRLPDSPWRDVAGMLRSLGYATSAAENPTAPNVQDWLKRAQDAFMQGYLTVSGRALSAADEALLHAYVADKAVYEVVYETRNRPDWVTIPLGALQALVR